MNKGNNKNMDHQKIEKIFTNLFNAVINLSKICFYGIKGIRSRPLNFWLFMTVVLLLIFHSSWNEYWHLILLKKIWPALFSDKVLIWLLEQNSWDHFYSLSGTFIVSVLITFGIKEFSKVRRIKRAIEDFGFETKSGRKPKLLKIEEIAEGRSKLIVSSGGQGIEKFKAKKSDLTASIGQIVQGIHTQEGNLSNVEILLCEKELTKMFHFKEHTSLLERPYSFIIGKTYKGPIVQEIRSLPHMYIAGTTGSGKSNFFNNVILGIMRSSSKVQFYLIDFKNGLEVRDYKDFPNVKIAKDENKAIEILNELNDLMDERYKYLENKGKRKIDPKADDMDVIIVAFDEVSEAFDTDISDKDKKAKRKEIYDKAHRLAKLSRAAGFNMIFATQKIKKQLLPTEIQTNINGRMVFQMPTNADSVTALGNKRAKDLPSIEGRAIWNKGNRFVEVQAPFLSDEDIKSEVKIQFEKFQSLYGDKKGTSSDCDKSGNKSTQSTFQELNTVDVK